MTSVLFAYWLFSIAMTVAALVVARRIAHSQRDAAVLNGAGDDLARAIGEMVSRGIDGSLLPGQRRSLGDIEILFREHHDPYRTLSELLGQLTATFVSRRDASSDLPTVIKAIFQIQATLQLSLADLGRCLAIVDTRLRSDKTAAKPVHRIEIPCVGAVLDSRTMIALNSGTHVRQPLGVISLDADGKTISKAKVICG